MISETEYHRLAGECLESLSDVCEEKDAAGELEAELEAGILTIIINGKQWLVSKHAPSRQIWLSSPVSGGLHFAYQDGLWMLPDGRELKAVLGAETKVAF